MADVLTIPARPAAEITYRNRPYVCGAVGRWDAETLRRLTDASPGELREIHSSPLAALWSTGTPETWTAAGRRGFFWGPLAEGGAPSSWTAAAEQRLAAGLEVTGHEAVLHTCGLGMQDLYLRRHGDALYFSVRIDPLLDIVDGPLHVDWSAWASVLAVTSPLGDETPFLEVRRMVAATAWRARPGALERVEFEPAWLGVEPDGKATAADIVDVVASHCGARRAAITLSGGWDSRLLAVLARRRRRRMVAWTTSNDDGRDRDIEFSRHVAGALGLTHRIFVPGPDAWVAERSAVRHRLNFQTTHHVWIMPLARQLHGRDEQFLDGLAGDVLLKSLFVDRETAEAGDPGERRRLLWNKLAENRLGQPALFARGVGAAFEDMSRTAFAAAVARFDGHRAAPTLGVLHTRTARAIASSAQWLLAPETDVRLPFVHPDVLNAALRVPLDVKVGGGFYREILHAADARVAALPSTNDTPPQGKRGTRRQTDPEALAAMAGAIMSSEGARRILSSELRLALKDPRALSLIGGSLTGLRVLNWASVLGEWQSTYAARLASLEFEGSG
ncbi:MAG: asparagine synthase-related protein [Actinomadura sp.]